MVAVPLVYKWDFHHQTVGWQQIFYCLLKTSINTFNIVSLSKQLYGLLETTTFSHLADLSPANNAARDAARTWDRPHPPWFRITVI